ncbi:hypothetical protein LPJ56_000974 [Coemansia sp. RSA 2599]|nr:hypothetical protein LPJ75_000569 [Coemansia sp. RSA 2598]KAJ1828649.1 hypothetical protein LPJ56_000974 [Coemansia sp. RSA 2599]
MIDREGVTSGIKRKYGVTLRPSWLEQCAAHIEAEMQRIAAEQPGHAGIQHLEAQTRLVYEQLLHSEISASCHPTLEVDPSTATVTRIPPGSPGGGVLLQIQEIMDIGVSKFSMWEALKEKEDFEQRGIRPSYLAPALDNDDDDDDGGAGVFTAQGTQTQAGTGAAGDAAGEREPRIPHGMLKLVLTDGKARFPAIEMVPVPQLSVELPIGTKVLVTAGQVLLQPTGTLCLRPDGVQVLGGAPTQYQELTLRSRIESILGVR